MSSESNAETKAVVLPWLTSISAPPVVQVPAAWSPRRPIRRDVQLPVVPQPRGPLPPGPLAPPPSPAPARKPSKPAPAPPQSNPPQARRLAGPEWKLNVVVFAALRFSAFETRPFKTKEGFVVVASSHPRKPALLFVEKRQHAPSVRVAPSDDKPFRTAREADFVHRARRQLNGALKGLPQLGSEKQIRRLLQVLDECDKQVAKGAPPLIERSSQRAAPYVTSYIRVVSGGLPSLGRRR